MSSFSIKLSALGLVMAVSAFASVPALAMPALTSAPALSAAGAPVETAAMRHRMKHHMMHHRKHHMKHHKM